MQQEAALGRGDRIPNFRLPDQSGATRSFYHDVKGGAVLLLALGSLNSPQSKEALSLLSAKFQTLAEQGVELFAVTQDGPIAVSAVAEGQNLNFHLYADPPRSITGRLLAREAAMGGGQVPFRLFFLDRNQRIVTLLEGTIGQEKFTAALDNLLREISYLDAPRTLSNPAPVLIVPRVLDDATCKELIGLWQKEHHEGGFSTGQVNSYDPDKKKTLEHVIEDPKLIRRLNTTLARRLSPELGKAFNFRQSFQFDVPVVMSYQPDRGDFFGLHRDDLRPQNKRIFAMSLNLNDSFEGGELAFPEYSPHGFRLDAGSAAIFACGLLHEAKPVISGQRFVLTNFFCAADNHQKSGAAGRRTSVQL